MQENRLYETSEPKLLPPPFPARVPSTNAVLREVLAAGFRHRRLGMTSFFGILAGALLVVLLKPISYQATMKILVRNERVDPAVSPAANAASQIAPITVEQLNSEVELLKSEDVLRKVALQTGFLPKKSRLPWGPKSDQQRLDAAVQFLRKGVDAGLVPRSNLIEVRLALPNPQLATKVLNTLGDDYIEKHLEVHRSSGQYQFFSQEAERYRKEMEAAEARLTQSDAVDPKLSLDLTVQKQKDFEATLQQTKAEIEATQHQLQILEQQQTAMPPRITTQMRSSDNGGLLQSLKGTLLTLQLKRTELLTKYQPTYRPVVELDKQISETEAAIAAAENSPTRDQTTDQDPVYLWVRSEIAKSKSQLVALQSRAAAMQQTIDAYHQHAQLLDKQTVEQGDLTRAAKTAESNYLLYAQKSEEARITDALDARRMLNIAIAETAHAEPASSIWMRLTMSLVLALIVSAGMIVLAEYFDPTFRTPAEVARLLAVPVLASLPAERESEGLVRS